MEFRGETTGGKKMTHKLKMRTCVQKLLIICSGFMLAFCNNKNPKEDRLGGKALSIDTIKKEISMLRDGGLSPYYYETRKVSSAIGLNSIEEGFDSLQIRIWYPSLINTKVVTISKLEGGWEAFVYNYRYDVQNGVDTIVGNPRKILTPISGWSKFINDLLELGVTTLPDFQKIPGYGGFGADGITFSIEVADTDKYRFYSYHQPLDKQKFDEAKKLVQIITLLNREFGLSTDLE
jgi:hypothetical protein